jgi:DeoR family fructose operon transcriptional repressor
MRAIFSEERHQTILRKLAEEKRIQVNEIAQSLNVSVDTVRRDLSLLEEKGFLKRTHGGAIPASKVREKRHHPLREIGEQFGYYHGIARKAAGYIGAGDTVFIYGAKAQCLMIQYLPTDIPFTVVTNSLDIAGDLREFPNVEVYMIGGRMNRAGLLHGTVAADSVKPFGFDIGFINAGGLSARRGLTRGSADVALLDRAVASASRKLICLLPHEKLGYDAFYTTINAAEIDIVITDPDAVEDELEQLKELGVEVVIA